MTHPIDQVQLDFEPQSLLLMNIILGLVMFGVALDLRVEDFKRVLTHPWAVAVGVLTQLLLLPALTYGLTLLIGPVPSIALGMILVAACPGGNISNFITHLGGGNTGLSITITSISTMCCVLTTPFHLAFWGSLQPGTSAILQEVAVSPWQMFKTIATLLLFPLTLGMALAHFKPDWAKKMQKPFKILSVVCFLGFVAVALGKNLGPFLDNIGEIFGIVALHNTSAFALGAFCAWAARLEGRTQRAVTVEVGIQNSGLGLILIFNFFNGLGGMATIAAWWGVWHMIAGLTLAFFWTRRDRAREAAESEPETAAA